MGIEPFDCSVTQTLNVSCILDVVVEDSLRRVFVDVRGQRRIHAGRSSIKGQEQLREVPSASNMDYP